jgi:outer membrane receptor protein involved in Fe transport
MPPQAAPSGTLNRSGETMISKFAESRTARALAKAGLRSRVAGLAVSLALLALVPPAHADGVRYQLDIPAKSLVAALEDLRAKTQVQIVYEPAQLAGLQAPALSGSFTVEEALGKLLANARLVIKADGRGTIVIKPAEAKATAAPAVVKLDTIVVTAEKREQSAKDVAGSLTALSGSALDGLGAKTMGDYARYVPGLTFISVQPGMGQLTLRGVTTGVKQSGATVGTYVDDIPFTPFSRTASGTTVVPDVDTFDVQRIEVLRGPQGTLYGAGAMGGLLKYVTTPPDLKNREGRVDVETSSTSQGGTDVAAKGMVNLPLSDSLALRVSGYTRRVPGFIRDVGTGKDDENQATLEGARVALLYKPNQQFMAKLSALTQSNDVHGTPAMDVNFKTGAPVYGDLQQSRALQEQTKQTYKIYNLLVSGDLGWGTALSSTSYSDISIKTRGDLTALYGGLLTGYAAKLGSPQTSAPLVDIKADIGGKRWAQEFRLTSPNNQQFEWLLGAYYTREDTDTGQTINGIPAQGNSLPALLQAPLYLQVPSRYSESAGFANVDYYFSKQFDLAFGVRVSRNDQSSDQSSRGLLINPTAPTTLVQYGSTSNDTSSTYHLAARWRPSDELTFYTSAGSGYRPGGPNVLPTNATAPSSYGPDTLWSYEAGLKSLWLQRQLSLDLTAFRINWSDIQLSSTVGGLQYLSNGGKASSSGLEFALRYRPVADLTLGFSGAYTDAKLGANAPGVGGASGDTLPTIPKWASTLVADYRFGVSDDWSGSIGASLAYTGQRNSSYLGSTTNPNMVLESYQVLNIRAGLSSAQWDLSVFVDNLLDKRAYTSMDTSSVAAGGAAKATVVTPRTVGLRVSRLF